MVTAAEKVDAARTRWNAATAAWSKDDGGDMVLTVQRGEQVMFTAIDLICALEDQVTELSGR